MTIVTTFPENEFSISRVVQEEAVHAARAAGLVRQGAVVTTDGDVCILTTIWA